MFTYVFRRGCILAALLLTAFPAACTTEERDPSGAAIAAAAETRAPVETEVKHMLSLGDSYTIGESVDASGRWPVQLVDLLRASGHRLEDPQILATTGWTTDELAAAIAAAAFDPPYDLVTLLIGVNNQYRGYNLEAYQEEFQALLWTAIELAGGDPGHVIVVSIPDWGMTPFAARDPRSPAVITAEVEAFNQVNLEVTRALGARYVDIFPISQLGYDDPALIAGDGLHPSAAQYRLWAEAVLPIALDILGNH